MASLSKWFKKTFVPERSIKDPLKWAKSTFVPGESIKDPAKFIESTFKPEGSIKDPIGFVASTFLPESVHRGIFGEPADKAIPQTPQVPTLADALARITTAEDLRRRRGRASSILSERPEQPLGYTGGGTLSAAKLLGG